MASGNKSAVFRSLPMLSRRLKSLPQSSNSSLWQPWSSTWIWQDRISVISPLCAGAHDIAETGSLHVFDWNGGKPSKPV